MSLKELDANAEVEDYHEPLEAYLQLMTKGNATYKKVKELYTLVPKYDMCLIKIKTNEGDELHE